MRMKFILLAFALLAGGGLAFHYLHGHGHDHEAGGGLQLNAGQKWATDQPLRDGMDRIRELVSSANLSSGASGSEALATGIRQQVDYMIANCKLAPAADETFHVMIADLLEGADLVTKKNDPQRGLAVMRRALETYPKYFDHAGWSGLGDP